MLDKIYLDIKAAKDEMVRHEQSWQRAIFPIKFMFLAVIGSSGGKAVHFIVQPLLIFDAATAPICLQVLRIDASHSM